MIYGRDDQVDQMWDQLSFVFRKYRPLGGWLNDFEFLVH